MPKTNPEDPAQRILAGFQANALKRVNVLLGELLPHGNCTEDFFKLVQRAHAEAISHLQQAVDVGDLWTPAELEKCTSMTANKLCLMAGIFTHMASIVGGGGAALDVLYQEGKGTPEYIENTKRDLIQGVLVHLLKALKEIK